MKIKINGQSQNLPGSWDEVTFATFLKLADCANEIQCLAVFLNISYDTIRKANISNLEEIVAHISFLNKPMPDYLPAEILGYPVPMNLKFESVGRFEDVKSIAQSFKRIEDGKLAPGELEKYAEIVGVYAMPNYLEAKPNEQKEFALQFLNAPCWEVMAVGNFTLMKLAALAQRQPARFQVLNILANKLRRAILRLLNRMGFIRH